MNHLLPIPQGNVIVRPGTLADVPFIDSLQRLHTKQVGWMPTAQLEGKVRLGQVLVAEGRDGETERRRDEVKGADVAAAHSVSSSLGLSVSTRPVSTPL